jgi:DNA-binding NarL/FixJ family response regulator
MIERFQRLTPRQHEIARLIADGLTNAEIADRIFISEQTVKNHVTGILDTLGVRHRGRIAYWLGRSDERERERDGRPPLLRELDEACAWLRETAA